MAARQIELPHYFLDLDSVDLVSHYASRGMGITRTGEPRSVCGYGSHPSGDGCMRRLANIAFDQAETENLRFEETPSWQLTTLDISR
jgi:hypothetical protein